MALKGTGEDRPKKFQGTVDIEAEIETFPLPGEWL